MIQKPYRFFREVFVPSPVMVDCPNCGSKMITPEILPEIIKADLAEGFILDWRVGRCPKCKAECILPLGYKGESTS